MDALSLFFQKHWLDILSTILGLLYLYFEYKAHILLWFVGIVMPAIDIYLYYDHGLYADAGMALYYTLVGIYGFFVWKFKKDEKGKGGGSISHFPKKYIFPSFLVFLLAWGAVYYILKRFTNSNVPVTDSFTNALSFVALWALSRKYMEQWLLWLLVDLVSFVLYFYKGIPFKGSLYALYSVIAVLGYFKWHRMMREEKWAST